MFYDFSKISLIDKLIDENPDSEKDNLLYFNHDNLMSYLLRDIENLLNSRIIWEKIDDELSEVRSSILYCGLPDFSSMPFSSTEGQHYLCSLVEDTIKEFEPRIQNPRVSITNELNSIDRVLKLQIKAYCHIGDKLEEILFDSEVEPISLAIRLRKNNE